jgi:GMP synthase (glutamine-hydrolysing)
LLAKELGGKVEPSHHREYGYNVVSWSELSFGQQKVWMSHGDIVTEAPKGARLIALSENKLAAGFIGDGIFAVQFHPEVEHTENGDKVLKYFASDMCGAQPQWTAPKIWDQLKSEIPKKVGSEHVIVGLSGGVDSTVTAVLLTKILGKEQVHCVFVNNGLLRLNEYDQVLHQYQDLGLNIKGVDASREFLKELKDVEDPEQKRKIIGRVFIETFEKQITPQIKWLAQGTLYPDVIESVSSFGGPSQTIKSHHNVGGLPEKMKLKLLEPLRELFKDEVRRLGKELNLNDQLIGRHPFPGPGLAIRIIGAVDEQKLEILKKADAVFINKLKSSGIYNQIWQAFCVLLPVKTVGVQGDGRTYDYVLALRAVTSKDGMTADWFSFSTDFLREVSNDITNQVKGINRIVYDVTSKPPATIEWE